MASHSNGQIFTSRLVMARSGFPYCCTTDGTSYNSDDESARLLGCRSRSERCDELATFSREVVATKSATRDYKRGQRAKINAVLCCKNRDLRVDKPGWRNWQTQRTQNPPVLSTVGVQLPLPAP